MWVPRGHDTRGRFDRGDVVAWLPTDAGEGATDVHRATAHRDRADIAGHFRVPRRQVTAGVQLSDVVPRLPLDRREGPAQVPATAPVRGNRMDVARDVRVRMLHGGRTRIHGGRGTCVGSHLREIAADVDRGAIGHDAIDEPIGAPRGCERRGHGGNGGHRSDREGCGEQGKCEGVLERAHGDLRCKGSASAASRCSRAAPASTTSVIL